MPQSAKAAVSHAAATPPVSRLTFEAPCRAAEKLARDAARLAGLLECLDIVLHAADPDEIEAVGLGGFVALFNEVHVSAETLAKAAGAHAAEVRGDL